ncbi:hypothetical protein KEM48_000601 [Puccinia striiformis f. sp. tritici PST-130]|nr:hypothetical protein KEM48_000601 [Puccinia striiformis f. sp. tritici PST-130]
MSYKVWDLWPSLSFKLGLITRLQTPSASPFPSISPKGSLFTTSSRFRLMCSALTTPEILTWSSLLSDEEPQTLKTLTTICQLFGAFQIEENAAYFLKYEFYTPKQMDIVSETVTRLCAEVRGCVVLLIDAFRHSDHIINSPFGKYDGNIYSAYFNAVQVANPLPPVHPYFDRLMKPMLTQEPLEMGDASQIGINQEIEEIQQERLQGVNKSNEGAIPLTESQRQETEGVAEWEKKFPSKRAKKLFYYF